LNLSVIDQRKMFLYAEILSTDRTDNTIRADEFPVVLATDDPVLHALCGVRA